MGKLGDFFSYAAIFLALAGVAVAVWFFLKKKKVTESQQIAQFAHLELPREGVLFQEGLLSGKGTPLEKLLQESASPVAISYRAVKRQELSSLKTVAVPESMQKAIVDIIRAASPKGPTLYKVVLPKGMELAKAIGKEGLRGFSRTGGKTAHALLKPVGAAGAVGAAAVTAWPVLAVAGATMAMDAISQHEQREFQRKISASLGRLEENIYSERIKDQRTADKQLSRAILLMLDGKASPLEVALKGADDEFHRAETFLERNSELISQLVDDDGKVDYRRLEKALGGKDVGVDNFGRDLQLAKAAISLKKKALVADAAHHALTNPEKSFENFRALLARETDAYESAVAMSQNISKAVANLELKGRWHDKALEWAHVAPKSVAQRQTEIRSLVSDPKSPSSSDFTFLVTETGEVRQAITTGKEL